MYGTKSKASTMRCRAFTLLELLLAVSILSVITTVAYMSFSVVTSAWRRGNELADKVHHGDFIIDQLVMALRSTYYPQNLKGKPSDYGFWMEDNGDGEGASDKISWVKLGSALTGRHQEFKGSPHRVVFTVEEGEDDVPLVNVRAWRLLGQPEEFDPEEDIEPYSLSFGIVGFNCRTAEEISDEEIEWLDGWDDTNRIPRLLELTLYVSPLDEGEDPIEVKRMLEIPVAPLSWGK